MASKYCFQAAVEKHLSLVFQSLDGGWEGHDYDVTVVVQRDGLDRHDVVMDFRDLEAALDTVLEPMRGHTLQELGMAEPHDVAERIATAITPSLVPPVTLASVSLRDGTGRQITLQQ
jgi:6-pyruvoyl-tetrahydropterin synthase